MNGGSPENIRTLVIDVGGTHVKWVATGHPRAARFKSGPKMTPAKMIDKILKLTADWQFERVSIGYPGVVLNGKIMREPYNLATGWVDYDFAKAFGRPVRLINDAAMQALGAYRGGRMLFLGLGTGLGSALIVHHEIVPLELGHLHCKGHRTYEDYVGERGRRRRGNKKWLTKVRKVIKGFSEALLPDYIVLGGGNASRIKHLPPKARRGENAQAFTGGFRLWDSEIDRPGTE